MQDRFILTTPSEKTGFERQDSRDERRETRDERRVEFFERISGSRLSNLAFHKFGMQETRDSICRRKARRSQKRPNETRPLTV